MTKEQKEYVRVVVQNAVCENLYFFDIIENLEGFGLTENQVNWARENLDFKIYILGGE